MVLFKFTTMVFSIKLLQAQQELLFILKQVIIVNQVKQLKPLLIIVKFCSKTFGLHMFKIEMKSEHFLFKFNILYYFLMFSLGFWVFGFLGFLGFW